MNSQLLAQPQVQQSHSVGFMNTGDFEHSQRVAKMFSASKIVPKEYQGDLPSCVIALNMAARIGADPLMVMQNLVVVHGKPTWSSQFLIATFNTCGRFSSLRYEFFGDKDKDTWGCRAVATELATGEKLVGTDVTIAIAKAEGWYGRNGSKWKTMPQQMLMYRAASWFVRANAPEISMGLHTQDEIIDIEPIDVTPIAENITEEKPAAKTRAKSKSVDTLLGGTPADEIKEAPVEAVAETIIEPAMVAPTPEPVQAPVAPPVVQEPIEADYSDMPTDLPPIEGTIPVGELRPESAGTMPIPELASEPEPAKYDPNHVLNEWRAKIKACNSTTELIQLMNEMPTHYKQNSCKADLAKRQEELKAIEAKSSQSIVNFEHWNKKITECNSREEFMNLQKEMPEVVRNDAGIKANLKQREDFGTQNFPENW